MKRILVIDDDTTMLKVLSILLAGHGYDVVTTMDSQEGMDLLESEDFDLLVADIIMPEKTGTEIIQETHINFPELPIIAISGGGFWEAESYLKTANAAGACKTFKKPFEPDELVQTVNEILK